MFDVLKCYLIEQPKTKQSGHLNLIIYLGIYPTKNVLVAGKN